jgi:CheY-like chemotaxis protein
MPARVLVVDDEPAIQSVLKLILLSEGYDVVVAASGAEALTCVTQQPPAVVLLDLQMPGMNGWQVHDQVRRTMPGVPIVYMSAARHVQREAAAHQAAGYLAKPFDVDGVVDTVARFVPNPAP